MIAVKWKDLPILRNEGIMIIATTRALLICSLLFMIGMDSAHARGRELKIGIYQNPPKVYVENDGTPAGFIVKIMNEIAEAEKWNTEYVFGTWEENMLRLRRGGLDMLLDVTYSDERALLYDFNSVPVIESWLQVFTLKGKKIELIQDLDGLRIAVLRGSHQHAYFRDRARRNYQIDYTLQDYPDYRGTADALRSGSADAIVADRFFYYSELRGKDIVPTPVIVDPANIMFAFTRGADRELVAAVDRRLSSMKNDPDSAYYRILQKGLSMKLPAVIPRYILMVIGAVVVIALALGGAAIVLRAQVARKTRELGIRNEELERAGAELESALELKDVLLGELFHRTGNNMQVICSLLTLQADASVDEGLRNGLRDAVHRIRAMSMVHERFDPARNLSRIDMETYLKELAINLRGAFGFSEAEIGFDFAIEPVLILFDYAIPCGLVINELLTNSFKHAFPDKPTGGLIAISLAVSEDATLRIEYRDNGIGYGNAGEEPPTDSIGMKIIRGIVEHQLAGAVDFSGRGGIFCGITFRMSGYRERV